jgi:hypothetical protein
MPRNACHFDFSSDKLYGFGFFHAAKLRTFSGD